MLRTVQAVLPLGTGNLLSAFLADGLFHERQLFHTTGTDQLSFGQHNAAADRAAAGEKEVG